MCAVYYKSNREDLPLSVPEINTGGLGLKIAIIARLDVDARPNSNSLHSGVDFS
jgi:hypothetical protein